MKHKNENQATKQFYTEIIIKVEKNKNQTPQSQLAALPPFQCCTPAAFVASPGLAGSLREKLGHEL